MLKKCKTGRLKGEAHPNAKLLDSDVNLCRELSDSGMSYGKIAEKMGCAKSTVAGFVQGRRRGVRV